MATKVKAPTVAAATTVEDMLPLPQLAPFSITPLTPAQSLTRFRVPEGYHLALVASERRITPKFYILSIT